MTIRILLGMTVKEAADAVKAALWENAWTEWDKDREMERHYQDDMRRG